MPWVVIDKRVRSSNISNASRRAACCRRDASRPRFGDVRICFRVLSQDMCISPYQVFLVEFFASEEKISDCLYSLLPESLLLFPVLRSALLLGPAQESACIPMSP